MVKNIKYIFELYFKISVMSDEKKYYTPSIEEFHVGFEYEVMIANENYDGYDWMKITYPRDPLIGESISRKSNMGDIRVKYLDKEDIESLGFESSLMYGYDNGDHCIIDKKDQWYEIVEKYSVVTLFYGKIKNLSELKVLLKQLGIKINEK